MSQYNFTNNWFEKTARTVWDQLIPQIKPKRILEIGSYEGASSCYLIEKLADESEIEIHCIDTWEGSKEHNSGSIHEADMFTVESRFRSNVKIATEQSANKVNLFVHKGLSDFCLAKLLAEGRRNFFDFIYVDGSHQAPDVVCDAVLGFRLLRVGGLMVFDDYLWAENLTTGIDPIRCPKPAIDAFTNLYCRKIRVISAPLYQIYVQKISD